MDSNRGTCNFESVVSMCIIHQEHSMGEITDSKLHVSRLLFIHRLYRQEPGRCLMARQQIEFIDNERFTNLGDHKQRIISDRQSYTRLASICTCVLERKR